MQQSKGNTMFDTTNIYLFILNFLLLTLIPTGSTFQCLRHTSRYRDITSLALTSSAVLEVKPVMTSSVDVSGLCEVTLNVRKVFKDTLSAHNESISGSGGVGNPSKRIRVGFCVENLDSDGEGGAGGSVTDTKGCAERVFHEGNDKSYIVFVDQTERVEGDGATDLVVERLVSIHPPVEASKQGRRDARKYSCAKCGRKPSARLQPELFSMTVELKEKLELNCRTTGNPPPNVEWTLNGDVIDLSDKKYRVKNTKRGSKLRIRKAESSDCGEYQCRAENVLGESSSHSVYVTISPNVSCAAQQKHPCTQQTFCLNGGTCWVVTSIGTEFCACTEKFQGERCEGKVWTAPVMDDTGDSNRLLPLSIVALVFGVTTFVAMFLLIFYVSRKCSSVSRKKRYSKDSSTGKDYVKLLPEKSSSLSSAHRTQITHTDETDSAPGHRDQGVQTDHSLASPGSFPFIHVQIQSAIIQPSESRGQCSLTFDHEGQGQGMSPTRLLHTESIVSTGRDRLSAISMTPGPDSSEHDIELEDDLDYVDNYVEGLGSTEGQGEESRIRMRSHRSEITPLSTSEELRNNSAPVEVGRFFPSTDTSRHYGIPVRVEMPTDGDDRSDETGGRAEIDPTAFSESQDLCRNLLISQNNNHNYDSRVAKSSDAVDSMRRNSSNPDILESVGKDYARTHGNGTQHKAVGNSLPVVDLRNGGKILRRPRQVLDPYDSDPEATVV